MPVIKFIEFDGTEHEVDADDGMSIMEVAMKYDIPGIDADCGGACACGTCHVFLNEDWLEAAGVANSLEDAMLCMRPDREEVSRLSCQIEITESMDGMTVRMPEYQM